MSLQTTMARGAAAAADVAYREHIRNCVPCSGRARCKIGRELRDDRDATAEEVKRQRGLDEEVPDGQGELW